MIIIKYLKHSNYGDCTPAVMCSEQITITHDQWCVPCHHLACSPMFYAIESCRANF